MLRLLYPAEKPDEVIGIGEENSKIGELGCNLPGVVPEVNAKHNIGGVGVKEIVDAETICTGLGFGNDFIHDGYCLERERIAHVIIVNDPSQLVLLEEPRVALGVITVKGLLDSKYEIGAVLVAIKPLVDVRLFDRFVK